MKGKGTTFLLLTLVCLADMAFAFDAAASLIISGSTTVIAGTSDDLRITAADALGSVDTNYDGTRTLVFSGAPPSLNPVVQPTITDTNSDTQAFGAPTLIDFKKGVAEVKPNGKNGRMRLYRAGTFTVSVTDGVISSAGKGDLAVTVAPGPLSGFDVTVASPQQVGKPFSGTNTIAARDSFGNPLTDFDASKDSVTLTSTLGGTITGLGSAGNNILNRSSDFVSGVSDLSSKLTYNGPAGNGTLLAMASSGKSGVSNSFAMNLADATQLAFIQQPSNATAGAAIAPPVTVQVQDQTGAAVALAGVNVTLTLSSGTGTLGGTVQRTTDTTGLATFNDLTVNQVGSKQLTASATGLATITSQSFNITAGTPAKLAIQTQPSLAAVAGTPLTSQPVIAILDAANNIVTTDNSTTVTVQEAVGGPGGLTGTFTVKASNGLAAFTDLAETKAGTTALQFTSQPPLTPVTSGNITVSPAAAAKLAYVQQPTNVTAGVAISPPVAVQLTDAYNNNVAAAGVPVTMSLNSGTGTLSGTITRDSNGSGLASFNDLSINSPGQKVLLASSGSLSSVLSNSFAVSPGAATQVAFTQQPSSVVAGAVISPAVAVQLLDDVGNPITADGVAVTVALGGTGTLNGTLTRTTVGGIATFNDLSIQQSGDKTLTMSSPGLASVTSQSFTVSPAAAARTAFVQQPTSTTADAVISPPITVQIRDTYGNSVASAGIPVTMSLSSGTGTLTGTVTQNTDATGLASFNDLNIATTGDKVLTATASGLTAGASSSFTISAGAAADLAFVQQPTDAAVGTIITPAVVVRLKDAHGNDAANDNVPITLSLNGTGTLNGTTTKNTVGGLATFDNLSITETGQKSLTASSSGLKSKTSETFNITAGNPSTLAFVKQPSTTAVAGAPLAQQPVVAITDAQGNVVTTDNSTTVTASVSGTTLQGTVTVKAANGIVTFTNLAFVQAGTYQIQFNSQPTLTGVVSNAVTVTPAAATTLVFVQQPTSAAVGATIAPPVTVQLKDDFGNDVTTSGVTVTLSLGGGGTLNGTLSRATSNGLATFNDLSVTQIGQKTLTAAAPGLKSATSQTFTITGGAAAKLVIQRQPSGTATAGEPFSRQPVIAITDASGNIVTSDNSTVVTAHETAGGPGGLQGTVSVTAVNGIATFTDLAETKAGTISLDFTSQPVLTPVTSNAIAVSAASPSKLVFIVQPANTAAGMSITPAVTVQLRDAFDNDVPRSGVGVTITLTSGTGTLSGTTTRNTNSAGLATFGNLKISAAGVKILTASSNGLTSAVSAPFTIGAGTISRLVLQTQPSPTAAAGAPLAQQPIIALVDAAGNVVTSDNTTTVTAQESNGSAVLQGTATVRAVNGIVTFTDLAFTKTGTYKLQFTSQPAVTGVASNDIAVSAGAAAKLAFVQQPSNASAGAVIAPPVTVQLRDAFDNNVSTAGVTVTMSLSSGTGTLSGTVSRTTSSAGVASFNDLSINAPGQKVLTASSNGLTSAISAGFDIAAGAPAALAYVQQPTNVVSGGTIVPAVTVQLKDAVGNDLSTNGVAVTLTLNGTGTLKGTLTQSTANGRATFADLSIDQTGQKTLTASSAGLQSATSQTFTVAAGSANQLAFVQQPGNAVADAVLKPAVTVRIVDANGNTNVVSGTPITLTITNGDTLTGTTTKNTVDGVATFDDIRLRKAGQKTLIASSPGLPAVSSSPFTVTPAPAVKVAVESAADGTGTVLSTQSVASGSTITAYAITRDTYNNFVSNEAAASWSLQNVIGGVAAGDLAPSADKKSARFTGRAAGSAVIVASVSGLSSIPSGVLTVTAGSQYAKVLVETAPDGSGSVLANRTLTAGSSVTVYAVARDSANNFVRNVVADQWSLQTPTGGIVPQDLTPANDKKNATFTAHLIGQARIQASAGGITGTPSGLITVVAATAAKLEIAGGGSQETQINTEFPQRLRVKVTDTYGNPVGGVTVTFTAPTTGPGGTFSGGTNTAISDAAGVATAPAFTANSYSGIFTVTASAPGVTSSVSFTLTSKAGSGANIAVVEGTAQSTTVGTPFATRFKVTVKDDAGNAIGGALVRFSAPASGPSGNFPSGLTDSVRTTSAGEAISPAFTANYVAGSYAVIASTESGKTVSITLTNAPGPLQRFAVESDRGGRIDTQFVGTRFGIRIRALDGYDNAVTSFSDGVVITSTGELFVGGGNTPPFVSGVLSSYTVGFQKTGSVTIVATRSGGGASGTSNPFFVGNPRPLVHGVSPSIGVAGQNLVVQLTGRGFLTGVTSVSFGDGIGTSTVINSDTLMTVTLQIDGNAAPGPRDVTVINAPPVGGVAFIPSGFTIGNHPRPIVSSIVPSSAAQLQSVMLYVRGTNFLGNGFSHLYFTGDGITVDSASVDSATVIRAAVTISASASPGPRDVVIVNDGPGGGTDTLYRAFTVTPGVLAAPTLVQPPNGARSQASTLQLAWQASPGATGYQIQVARDASFTSEMIVFDSTANTSYQVGPLPNSSVYYWHVRAVSSAGMSGWSTAWSFDNLPPVSPTISLNNVFDFPDHPSPSDYTSYDYRIIGLPGASNSRLNNFIPGVQDVDWRIFWDNGGSVAYLVPFDGSSTFTFAPGRAFWMLKKGPWAVSVTIAAAPIDSVTHSVLVPVHSGWNLITNPMTWSIPWSDIQTANGTSEPIYSFEGLYNRSQSFDPYVGYYFFDDPQNPLGNLKIPYGPGLGKKGMQKPPGESAESWTVQVDLRVGQYVDKSTSFGVSSGASTGKDHFDFHRPRSFGDMPSVYFARPEWDSAYSTFASDVRPPFADKNSWKFTVASKGPKGGNLELDFHGLDGVPADMEVYLVDEGGASYHNLKQEGGTYRFVPASPTVDFTLLVGKKDALADELAGVVPRTFALDQNYPNPFNPSTAIPVALPVRADIELKIYNILGQEVKTLHKGMLEAGRHVFTWDGTNSFGTAVASGVYISRLTSGSGVHLGRKMLLVR